MMFPYNEVVDGERMTVNHDVTGSSPVRGATKKPIQSDGFSFGLFDQTSTCAIMIYIHLHTD